MTELEIAANLTSYAVALDRKDPALLRTCFAEDVVATYQGENYLHGTDAIIEYVTQALAPFARTQHQMGRTRIEIIKEPDRCEAETYCVAYLLEVGEGRLWMRGLRYRDEFCRRDGRWVVTTRSQAADWMVPLPAVPVVSRWPGSVGD